MAELILDKNKTALLMADFATSGIGQNPIAEERGTLDRAKEVLDGASLQCVHSALGYSSENTD